MCAGRADHRNGPESSPFLVERYLGNGKRWKDGHSHIPQVKLEIQGMYLYIKYRTKRIMNSYLPFCVRKWDFFNTLHNALYFFPSFSPDS